MVKRVTVYSVAGLFNVLFGAGGKLDYRINVPYLCNQPLVIFIFINGSIYYVNNSKCHFLVYNKY